jgi:hypothetical protein
MQSGSAAAITLSQAGDAFGKKPIAPKTDDFTAGVQTGLASTGDKQMV